jgi:hypothetical protein
VLRDILETISALEKTNKPSPECDAIITAQMSRGKSWRDAAIALGANSHQNLNWATGALIESFALSNTGKLSSKETAKIQQSIMGWISATISKSEVDAIAKSYGIEN